MPTADDLDLVQNQPLHPIVSRALSEGLAGWGKLTAGDFAVTATANDLEIQVAAGTAWYDGADTELGAAETHTLTSGDASDDRWDTVYFDTGTGSSGVREGTPSSTPTPPDVQGDELLLAVVYVAAGATDVADADILEWMPTAQQAGALRYPDSTGTYGIDDVESALDELQEAAQASAFPFDPSADLDTNAYPFANSDLANSSLDVVAGTALTTTNQSIGLGGSATLDVDGVTDSEIASDTAISRGKLDNRKATTTVSSSSYTTQDEEVVLVDTAAIGGASSITLASADAENGNTIVVTDLTGAASSNPITVDTEGSETIHGQASKTIETDGGALVFTSDGTNWALGGGGAGGGGVDPTLVFEGREGGTVADGDQGILVVDELADSETVEISKAALTTATVEAAPTDLNLELVSFDNAGSYTVRDTVIAGDGSTVHDRATGDPLVSWTNDTGGVISIGVIVTNATGSSQDVLALVEGEVSA